MVTSVAWKPVGKNVSSYVTIMVLYGKNRRLSSDRNFVFKSVTSRQKTTMSLLKGTASSSLSNILKSHKSNLHQWKPVILFIVTVLLHCDYQRVLLATDCKDGNGLQLEKVGPTFSSQSFRLRKFAKN